MGIKLTNCVSGAETGDDRMESLLIQTLLNEKEVKDAEDKMKQRFETLYDTSCDIIEIQDTEVADNMYLMRFTDKMEK